MASQEWRNKNRIRLREYAKVYYKNHKPFINLRSRESDARYTKSLKGLFSHAKASAKAKRMIWSITLEEYESFRKQNCSYCGANLPVTGIGLDRLDNAQGYTTANVVSCCKDCNLLRGDRLTPEETRVAVAAVITYRLGR